MVRVNALPACVTGFTPNIADRRSVLVTAPPLALGWINQLWGVACAGLFGRLWRWLFC